MPSIEDFGFSRFQRREPITVDIEEELVETNQLIPDKALGYAKLAIDTLEIGQKIQSKDYVAGVSGFLITVNKSGEGEIWANILYANQYSRVYVQTTAPASGMSQGDIWYDSDDGNKKYVYSGSAWVLAGAEVEWDDVLDGGSTKPDDSATVGSDWDTNLSNIPSSLFQIFYQATAPGSGMVTGDYWVDSDDNKVYRWSG